MRNMFRVKFHMVECKHVLILFLLQENSLEILSPGKENLTLKLYFKNTCYLLDAGTATRR